jgi:hypothetical protein
MNLRIILLSAFAATISLSFVTAADSPKPEPVQVLILGAYHFGNPGEDLHNMQVNDVRTPAKQAELADVAARLAKFKPTKIAVEAISDRADLAYANYQTFVPEMLTKNSDERMQIGYGTDEQSETLDYFPYGKVDAYAKEQARADSSPRLESRRKTSRRRWKRRKRPRRSS